MTWLEQVRRIAEEHGARAAEAVVVRSWLEGSKKECTSPRVRSLVESVEEEVALRLGEGLSLDLGDVVSAFEVLVPWEESRSHGAVYTPEAIGTFMAERALLTGYEQVVDPACGCGALLVAALRRGVALTGERASVVSERLTGADLSALSAARAEVVLDLACAALGDPEGSRAVILVGDSLEMAWERCYDVVIGNPPYVRWHTLAEEKRARLTERWSTLSSGSPNLYFAFFELARRLAPRSVQITPNSFFVTKAGAPLREWLAGEGSLVEVVDFGHVRVFDALTYTAITTTGEGGDVSYTRVGGVAELSKLPTPSVRRRSSLGGGAWRMVGKKDEKAVEAILSLPSLGSLAEVWYGVKTCRDRAYLVSGEADVLVKEYLGRRWEIEKEVTLPHVVVPDVRSDEEVEGSLQRIIWPYREVEGRAEVIPEEEMAELYPQCMAYLRGVRSELEGRDKGKKSYATWYAYARTQALLPGRERLLTPEYAGRPRFMRDARRALFSNGCAVALREGSGMELSHLQQILSSGVLHYFVEMTSSAIDSGFFSYQKSRLTPFGIPSLSQSEREELAGLQGGEADDFLAGCYGITLPGEWRRS